MKLVLIFLVGAALIGPIMSKVEQPAYRVISSEGRIQIRGYNKSIVAEAITTGERYEAINKGFRLLADYIFGNNVSSDKIAMTAPVTQQDSSKIAMTAPVTQQARGNQWSVRFIMPSEYDMLSLPKPVNSSVIIKEISAKTFAVIKFSGKNSKENISKHESKLVEYLSDKNIKPVSSPVYAFYNPPWTLPIFRRNEVMIEIVLDN